MDEGKTPNHTTWECPIAANAISELNMIRVAYLLAQRNAAKEQREDRANTECTCCAGDESQWFATNSCDRHTN